MVRQEPAKLPFPSSNLGATFMLFLVATPIGNLSDISLRALETLKKVDYILCEDTRTSGSLLNQYSIDKPLKSFHLFNEKKMEDSIIADLAKGLEIALISDAGTPGINDPGEALVQRCQKERLPYTGIPGPCSPILALTLSGFETSRFQFIGFLPKKPGEQKKALIDALFYEGITLFFESPHRIHKTLETIHRYAPDAEIALMRELTKRYEEVLRGRAQELLEAEIRGEIVVALKGGKKMSQDPRELLKELSENFDLEKAEALKLAAHLLGIPKKQLYLLDNS